MSDVLGVVHIDGQYYVTGQDYLDEGANQVIATGSHVIKLEMGRSTLSGKYQWNSSWPALTSSTSLTSIAQTSYFQSVFSNPQLNTYVITAYSPNIPSGGDGTEYWLNGTNATQRAAEQTSFYNLAKYLMQTYNGTGKTFLLENWEGDWALRDPNRNTQPTATAVQGMIDWLNAREAGIRQARAELGATSDVKVYGTVEVNRVGDAMNGDVFNGQSGWATVTNDVLPHTNMDFASYSAYDTMNNTSGTQSFANAVSYIASKLPSSAANGQNTHSVYVGEFGVAEDAKGAAGVNTAINNVINTVTTDGMPYALYWEIYSNELKSGFTAPVNGNDAAVNGFWMVKPDGTPGMAWHQWRQRIITSDPKRASTTAVKNGLTAVYQNSFSVADNTALPSYWSTASNGGGAITSSVNGGRFEMKFTGTVGGFPFGMATLNVGSLLGRGLNVGEYLQFDLHRENDTGIIGVEAFGLHHGSAATSGNSPLQLWPGSAWVPFSTGGGGSTPSYDWDTTRTIGLRLDSADGNFATVSYYLDGSYSGSWLYKTTATTLTSFSLFAQANVQNAGFSFDNVSVFARTLAGDANLDGKVDTLDFNALASNFGGTGKVWRTADFNSDGVVDTLDFNALAANFGKALPDDSMAPASLVPEPGSLALFLVGAALTLRRRRQ